MLFICRETIKLLKEARSPTAVSGRAFFPVTKSPAQKPKSEERILVLESDEALLSSILSALYQVAPLPD